MNDNEKQTLRVWMEKKGLPALMMRIFALGELGMDDDDDFFGEPTGPKGRTRLALGDADKEARDQLAAWMKECGLEVRIDAVGNMFGVLAAAEGGEDLPPLMLGSHIDTVGNAGPLDGVYGVLSGLTILQGFRDNGIKPPRPIMVAAFTNEEGVRYQPDMLGSMVFSGGCDLEKALNTRGIDGTILGEELKRIGYAGDLPPRHVTPCAYLELHIEQGPVLEQEKLQIGVVTGVQGISAREIIVDGAANHAGTTPTALRCDAGLAAARVIVFLRELSARTGILATAGSMSLEPGQVNVIPNRAVFTADLRDPDAQKLADANMELNRHLVRLEKEEGMSISCRTLSDWPPASFSPEIIDKIDAAAHKLGYTHKQMLSGAGHDAQMLARICPVGMIFVPSRAGLSHCPQEFTGPEDLKHGTMLLLETALDIINE